MTKGFVPEDISIVLQWSLTLKIESLNLILSTRSKLDTKSPARDETFARRQSRTMLSKRSRIQSVFNEHLLETQPYF